MNDPWESLELLTRKGRTVCRDVMTLHSMSAQANTWRNIFHFLISIRFGNLLVELSSTRFRENLVTILKCCGGESHQPRIEAFNPIYAFV